MSNEFPKYIVLTFKPNMLKIKTNQTLENMSRFNVNVWTVGILLGLSLINCYSTSQNKDLTQKLTNRLLEFSFNLYHLMPDKHNFAMSPLFVGNALGLALAGAGGNTLKQLKNVLCLNDFGEKSEINLAFNSLGLSFENVSEDAGGLETVLYVQEGFTIKKSYRKFMKNYFEASCANVDFVNDLDKTISQINDLLREETQGKFLELLVSNQKIRKYNSLLLVSAVILNTAALLVFDPKDNSRNKFTLSNDRRKQVEMMNLQDVLMYGESPELDAQILRMNYADGRLFAYFILPNTGTNSKQLKMKLSPLTFKSAINCLKKTWIKVQIPTFTLGNKHSMPSILSRLGVPDAFDEEKANFKGIADPEFSNAFLNDFTHFSYIRIDNNKESKHMIEKKSAFKNLRKKTFSKASKEFIADHPFIIIISDIAFNSIVLIGTVDDPSN